MASRSLAQADKSAPVGGDEGDMPYISVEAPSDEVLAVDGFV